MNGVNGVGAGHAARMDHSESVGHSRRPGTANHPGKHLGQLKHKQPLDETTAMPLVQQQLNAVNSGGSNTAKTGNTAKAGNQADLDAFATQMIMNDMNQMNANINDQLKFMSRFNAISSAF